MRYLRIVEKYSVEAGVDLVGTTEAELGSIWRKVSIKDRQYIVAVCRKYQKGIDAASAVKGYNYEGLLEHFLEGQFDDTVYHSKKPEVVGRYWGFVKKFDAERQEQVDTSELHKQELAAQQAMATLEAHTFLVFLAWFPGFLEASSSVFVISRLLRGFEQCFLGFAVFKRLGEQCFRSCHVFLEVVGCLFFGFMVVYRFLFVRDFTWLHLKCS